jgi:hypothetical protein
VRRRFHSCGDDAHNGGDRGRPRRVQSVGVRDFEPKKLVSSAAIVENEGTLGEEGVLADEES